MALKVFLKFLQIFAKMTLTKFLQLRFRNTGDTSDPLESYNKV